MMMIFRLLHAMFLNFIFTFLFPEGLISYIIPKGAPRGLEVELSDKTYDGENLGDRYVGGMGQLSDGQRGPDNFRSDIYGLGKGKIYQRLRRVRRS